MFQRFMRVCSMILVIVLLVNMLPASALGAALRDALETETTEQLVNKENIGQATQDGGEVTILGELTDKRTEYTKQYLLSDGTFLAAVYADAVHYEKDGAWEEIDNTLKVTAGAYTTTAGDWTVSFPQQLSSAKNITITKDGYTLSFGMAGRLNQSSGAVVASAGETVSLNAVSGSAETFAVAGAQVSLAQTHKVDLSEAKAAAKFEQLVQDKLYSKLSYEGVYANTDIVYDLQSNRVKESVILSKYDSTLRGYRYTLNTGGMIPVLDGKGNIAFYDAAQENIVMTMPAPFLEDANGVYNDDIQVTLTGSGSTYTLTYILPRQWLASAERAYPVILDPIVTAGTGVNNIADQTVGSIGSLSYTWSMLECGYDTSIGAERFFVAFTKLPSLTSADVIVDATVSLYKPIASSQAFYVGVHSVGSTWTSSGITWSNKPSTGPNAEDFNMVTSVGWYKWDVTNLARGWYETGTNTGMMFRASDAVEAAGVNHWSQFYSSDKGSYSPTLTIEYRNTSGLEDYWDYFSASAGRAGTGYVNAASGNLVFVRELLGFDGNLMPVSISTIYNASERNTNNYGMGFGWRTNFHQRVYASSSYYAWEDADGTKHFFTSTGTTGTYKDEDGLDLTLTTTGSGDATFCITDLYGNKSYFDASGRLKKIENNQHTKSNITIEHDGTSNRITTITDGADREYRFTYTDNLAIRIGYYGKGNTELAYVRFMYVDAVLRKITDQDGGASWYTTSSKLLTSVQDPNGAQLNFTYTTSSTKLPTRVTAVTEYSGTTAGNYLTFAYSNKWTKVQDKQGNEQYMQFNNRCNTVAVRDSDGNAVFAEYATDRNVTAEGNQLTLASNLQASVVNLLTDSSFESGNNWSSVSGTGAGYLVTSSDAYIGYYSLLVTASSSNDAEVSFGSFTVGAGESYSLTAYVKLDDDVEDGGAKLVIGNDQIDYTEGMYITSTEKGQWIQLEVSYTNTTSAAVTVYGKLVLDAGSAAYVDCVQLEKAASGGRYNLLENTDFTADSYWYATSGMTTDTRVTVDDDECAPGLDNNVMQITGSSTAHKYYFKTLNISGQAGDTFVLAGWAKGYAAPTDVSDRYFELRLELYYPDEGDYQSFSAKFNPQTDDWQYSAVQVTAEHEYEYMTVYLWYGKNVNTVWFDGIQLYKDGFGTSYKYDTNGDVISQTDAMGRTTTYEYTDRLLTKANNPDETITEYIYDDYKNITAKLDRSAADENGGRSTMQAYYNYDSYGNLSHTVVLDGDRKITTHTIYTADGNYPLVYVDESDQATTYNYDLNTGELISVSSPTISGTTTADCKVSYTYDDLSRVKTAAQGNMSVSYTYSGDLLTAVNTTSTPYGFTYGAFNQAQSVSAGGVTLATYHYNEENLLSRLDYGNGDHVQYTYNQKGQITQITYEDEKPITFTYARNGALVGMVDSITGRTTTYYYDAYDRQVMTVVGGTGYSYIQRVSYNALGQVTFTLESLNGSTMQTTYTYDRFGRAISSTLDHVSQSNTYDSAGKISTQTTTYIGAEIKKDSYTYLQYEYEDPENGDLTYRSTSKVQIHKIEYGGKTYTYTYTYDERGNISTIAIKDPNGVTKTTRYLYDAANQLIREDNQAAGYTWVWTYDSAGNIQTRTEHSYNATVSTANLGSGTVIDYLCAHEEDDGVWGDILVAYDGEPVYYDTIGNLIEDSTWTYTWEHGRQLKTMSKSGANWTFTYDADGMRTKRTTGSTTYQYFYTGSQLKKMTVGSNTLLFQYGTTGMPVGLTYNNTRYYYVTNLQGDVVAILNGSGTAVVTYTYDAWGNILTTTDTSGIGLASKNPLRYRAYVYDQETGLYYLQSRYYNPAMGRFISMDKYISTGQGFVGYNMFAYCLNNPVNYVDKNGKLADSYSGWLGDLLGELFYEWITGNEHPNRQAREIENEITRQQLQMAQDGLVATWDAYMRSYTIQEEMRLQQELIQYELAKDVAVRFYNVDWDRVARDSVNSAIAGFFEGTVVGGLSAAVGAPFTGGMSVPASALIVGLIGGAGGLVGGFVFALLDELSQEVN